MLDQKGLRQFEKDKETISFIKYSNGKHNITYNKKEILEIINLSLAIKSTPLSIKSEKHIRKITKTKRRSSPKSSVRKGK